MIIVFAMEASFLCFVVPITKGKKKYGSCQVLSVRVRRTEDDGITPKEVVIGECWLHSSNAQSTRTLPKRRRAHTM
jgi:hypothetical protein